MKSNLLISIAVILLTSTGYAFSQPADLINGHFNALAKHDVKAIAAGYADGAKVYSPNWEGAKTGQAGISEVYTRYFASTPDLSYKVNHIINAGEYIVAEYTVTGTLSKPEGNTPAYMKDKKYTLDYCAVFKIEAGKITKETDYFDQVAFLRQVGFFDQH
ncbi:nuclear transport factor 2 family protein [Mucilaginibacter sp.]|uniref:nuclear transport factor 2 family protein n=1 Tax=Mucilaginibacter sp. TaxID=1882438 RepID=UPI0028513C2E|nr:nuclear transport factor 2 family protein [Mucilaginibacter sp.]MDR3697569.1 nuclear transport factor 2 family protein [Mucilaginibacter sp.]